MSEPLPLTYNGVIYQVHPTTDASRDSLKAWVYAYVVRECVKLKDLFPASEYTIALGQTMQDLGPLKKYVPGTTRFQEILNTPEGACQYIRTILQQPLMTDKEVDAFINAKGDEFSTLVAIVDGIEDAPTDTNPKA